MAVVSLAEAPLLVAVDRVVMIVKILVTQRHEERIVSLDDLTSVDLFISYGSVGPVGHTFLSFNFDNAPPVCISIETRPEKGEGFSPMASAFKEYELFSAVGDERDLVGVRPQSPR